MNRFNVRTPIPGVVLAVILVSCPVASRAGLLGGVAAPAGYRSWTVKPGDGSEFTVSQVFVPLTARARLGASTDLVVSTAGAASSITTGGTSSSLDGASAVTSQVYSRLADDRLLLHVGLTVPSGTRDLTDEELAVARTIGLPVLGFPLKHYGRGLEWSAGATVARPLGSRAVGSLGAGAVLRRSYGLFRGEEDYQPSGEVAVTGGLDFGFAAEEGRDVPVRLDLTYRMFGADELGGRTVFEEGDQFELQTQASTSGERVRASGLARAVFKRDNTLVAPQGSSVGTYKANSGSGFFLRGRADAPLGFGWRGGLAGEWASVTGSDSFSRNGRVVGVGPVAGLTLGGSIGVQLEGVFLWGSLDGPEAGPDVDLSGMSFLVALSWAPAP